jgi:hypothetical protein
VPTQPSITAFAEAKQDEQAPGGAFGPTLSVTVSGTNPYLLVLIEYNGQGGNVRPDTRVTCTANGADLPLVRSPRGHPPSLQQFDPCAPIEVDLFVNWPAGLAVFGAVLPPGTYTIIPWTEFSQPIVVQAIALQDVDPVVPLSIADLDTGTFSSRLGRTSADPYSGGSFATTVGAYSLVIGQQIARLDFNPGSRLPYQITTADNLNPAQVTLLGTQLIAEGVDYVALGHPWVDDILGWTATVAAVSGLAWSQWDIYNAVPGLTSADSIQFLIEIHAVGEWGNYIPCQPQPRTFAWLIG